MHTCIHEIPERLMLASILKHLSLVPHLDVASAGSIVQVEGHLVHVESSVGIIATPIVICRCPPCELLLWIARQPPSLAIAPVDMATHTYTYSYIHTYTPIHTYMHACIHIYIHIHIYISTYIRTYIHACIHMHAYTHTYIHT